MAYKFQFGPSVMSGALEQEGNVTISDSGVLKMGADTVIDASRNVTAVSLSGSNSLDVAGQARLKSILNVSGAATFAGGITSTAGNRVFGATSFNDANITNVGSIALDSISADDGSSFSFGSNWTAAGRTCADLGTVTTADINGGSIDGATIGAAAQQSGKFTTLSASSELLIQDRTQLKSTLFVSGAATFASSIGAASVSSAGAVTAASLSASGDLNIADNATVNGTSTLHGLVTANAGVKSTSLSASADLIVQDRAQLKSALNVSGAFVAAGAISLNGASDTAADLAADSLYFRDADGTMHRESFVDYAAAIAGDGLAAASGVLSVSLTELTEAAVNVAADSLIFIDADGNVTRRDTFADYAAALVNSEPGFASSGGKLQFDPNSLAAASVASGDSIVLVDADDSNIPKKETVDDLATLFAGVGLSAASAVMALDLNELADAAVNVGADSIAIIDADDSNGSKKESIADLVAAMAGGGLSASNGVLSTQAGSVAVVGDANATLAEGMNAGSTTFTADRTWTLPAAPSDGDVVYVKAPANLDGNELIVLKGSASHRIDGAEQIEIESNGGAVSLMYIGSNQWVLF